jgi:hypothetical protein
MVNTWSAPMVHAALINHIADTYLGYAPRDWVADELARVPAQDSARAAGERALAAMRAGAPPAPPLAPYAGRYDHPVFGPVWIRLAERGLTLQMGEGQIADLEYHGDVGFYVAWRDPFFREFYGGQHVMFTAEGDSIVSFTTTLNRDQFTARKGGAPQRTAFITRRRGELHTKPASVTTSRDSFLTAARDATSRISVPSGFSQKFSARAE